MKQKDNIRTGRINQTKSMSEPDRIRRSSRYNYIDMKAETVSAREGFPGRLAELRQRKGLSGREMSLALGQGAGYINNIENGYNLPSMMMFFEICEFLDVSPRDFFAYTGIDPGCSFEEMIKDLTSNERDLLLKLAAALRREKE